MNETVLTVVGNVATEPTLRSTSSGVKVASFRLASTERRFDKGLNGWRDADTLFWWVSCWRSLGENVAESVVKGQPVVVQGRLRERTYDDKDGQRRTSLEIEASIVGHDLSKGIATFRKAAGVQRDVAPIDETDGAGPDDAVTDRVSSGFAKQDGEEASSIELGLGDTTAA
jgi:single-strand DNA-binding protein